MDGLLWKPSPPWAIVLGLDAYARKRTLAWERVIDFTGWRLLTVADLALDPGLRHHLPHPDVHVGAAVVASEGSSS